MLGTSTRTHGAAKLLSAGIENGGAPRVVPFFRESASLYRSQNRSVPTEGLSQECRLMLLPPSLVRFLPLRACMNLGGWSQRVSRVAVVRGHAKWAAKETLLRSAAAVAAPPIPGFACPALLELLVAEEERVNIAPARPSAAALRRVTCPEMACAHGTRVTLSHLHCNDAKS